MIGEIYERRNPLRRKEEEEVSVWVVLQKFQVAQRK
jgi:hypothetical protein